MKKQFKLTLPLVGEAMVWPGPGQHTFPEITLQRDQQYQHITSGLPCGLLAGSSGRVEIFLFKITLLINVLHNTTINIRTKRNISPGGYIHRRIYSFQYKKHCTE